MSFSPRAELEAFGRFLAAPRPIRQAELAASDWPLRAAFFVMLVLGIDTVLGAMMEPLSRWAGLGSKFPDTPNAAFVFSAVLLAPLSEELLFRAGLRIPAYSLYIGPWLCVLVFGPGHAGIVMAGGIALLALIAASLHWWLALRKPGRSFGFERRFVVRYAWVFWGYCALFAVAHVGNYEWHGWRGGLVLLAVLPQFVAGALLSYLRLRDGLRSSMLAHMLINAAGVALLATGA